MLVLNKPVVLFAVLNNK